MGSIKASLFISLDGVIEGPETWHLEYFDDEMGAVVGMLIDQAEATLLGRRTYDGFAAFWPSADPNDPLTEVMNNARKYVVSSTLREATWTNTTLIQGDVTAQLRALKENTEVGVTGSATLVSWMLEQGVLDELHLFVHPVVVGHGNKLFGEGDKVSLRLISSTSFKSGVQYVVYGPK